MVFGKSMDPLRNFGFLLRDVTRLYSLNFERHAVRLNLTLAQCKVLAYLQRNEGISQVRLATFTDTDPMTLVRILNCLEGSGLVERRPDPADRRAYGLFLQAAAIPVLRKIWRVADRARAETLSGLSIADRAQLVMLMQRIQSNVDALIPGLADIGEAKPKQARKYARMHAKSAKS